MTALQAPLRIQKEVWAGSNKLVGNLRMQNFEFSSAGFV